MKWTHLITVFMIWFTALIPGFEIESRAVTALMDELAALMGPYQPLKIH